MSFFYNLKRFTPVVMSCAEMSCAGLSCAELGCAESRYNRENRGAEGVGIFFGFLYQNLDGVL